MIIFLNDDAFEVDPVRLTEWVENNGTLLNEGNALDRVFMGERPLVVVTERAKNEIDDSDRSN